MNQSEMDNAKDCLWWGLFLDEDLPCELSDPITDQHVTFGFKSTPPEGLDWNATYSIEIIGYGNDGTNEGYECVIPDELAWAYDGADIPHITIGVSNGGRPVDTKNLDFEEEVPFTVYGKLGYFLKGEYHI